MSKRISALLVAGVLVVAGCSPASLQRPVDFELPDNAKSIEVEDGVSARATGVLTIDTGGLEIGSGSIEIDPDVITITPADTSGGKGRINLHGENTLDVTVWIAAPDELDTVCETGDEYGLFEVELDEDYRPIGVSPSTITLKSRTRQLINEGSFSFCVEVVSPVAGTVTIEKFTLNLGL